MLCKAHTKHSIRKQTFHSNIASMHITIAIEQVKSQMTKPRGAWVVHVTTDMMLLIIAIPYIFYWDSQLTRPCSPSHICWLGNACVSRFTCGRVSCAQPQSSDLRPLSPMVSCDSIESGCSDHVRRPIQDDQGAVSIRKTVLPGMAIPMLKIRRPNGRLIFNMEIAIRR